MDKERRKDEENKIGTVGETRHVETERLRDRARKMVTRDLVIHKCVAGVDPPHRKGASATLT